MSEQENKGSRMWQRFSERARKAVFYAQEEAQKLGEGYVSTEHLVLGLIRDTDNMAVRILERCGISCNRLRAEIEKQLPRGDARPSQDMTLTPRAKRILDFSYDEARTLNNNYIGTEHILLGAIREGDGLAGRVLAKLGVKLEAARNIAAEINGVVLTPPEVTITPVEPPKTATYLAPISEKPTLIMHKFEKDDVVELTGPKEGTSLSVSESPFYLKPSEVIYCRQIGNNGLIRIPNLDIVVTLEAYVNFLQKNVVVIV